MAGRPETSLWSLVTCRAVEIEASTESPLATRADTVVILDFKINPLIVWVWVGFLLTIVGTLIAAWPKRSRLQAA